MNDCIQEIKYLPLCFGNYQVIKNLNGGGGNAYTLPRYIQGYDEFAIHSKL